MQDLVKDWMIDLVVYVHPDDLVLDALAKMRRRYLNSLIVKPTEDSMEYGILTTTDICDKIVAQGRDPSKTRIREIMSSPLIAISPDETIFECARRMHTHQIHQLPVVDQDNGIVGMISATDFLVVAEALGHGGEDRKLS